MTVFGWDGDEPPPKVELHAVSDSRLKQNTAITATPTFERIRTLHHR
jgi:hypothetical protein